MLFRSVADVRATGGVVAVPPSVGKNGQGYEIVRGNWADVQRLPTVPDAVRRLLRRGSGEGDETEQLKALGQVSEGQRNLTLWRTAMFAARNLTSLEELVAHCRDHNRNCTPSAIFGQKQGLEQERVFGSS